MERTCAYFEHSAYCGECRCSLPVPVIRTDTPSGFRGPALPTTRHRRGPERFACGSRRRIRARCKPGESHNSGCVALPRPAVLVRFTRSAVKAVVRRGPGVREREQGAGVRPLRRLGPGSGRRAPRSRNRSPLQDKRPGRNARSPATLGLGPRLPKHFLRTRLASPPGGIC